MYRLLRNPERAAYADGRPLEIFFFLVDEDSARLARISASSGWRVTLHDFRIGLAELRSLCRKVSASFPSVGKMLIPTLQPRW